MIHILQILLDMYPYLPVYNLNDWQIKHDIDVNKW